MGVIIMPELNGITTEKELLEYNVPMISPLNETNDNTSSGGGTISGSDDITWSISWGENGFTNYSWQVPTWDKFWSEFESQFEQGTLESWLRENMTITLGVTWQITGNGYFFGCATHT